MFAPGRMRLSREGGCVLDAKSGHGRSFIWPCIVSWGILTQTYKVPILVSCRHTVSAQ